MPEGPEVFTTAQFIDEIIRGMTLIELDHLTEKCLYGDPSGRPEGKVLRVRSRGKKIIIDLDNGDYIMIALLMEGKLHLKPANKHLHVTMTFLGDDKRKIKLYYCESRPFGGVYYCCGEEDLEVCLRGVGIDLIQDRVTLKQWLEVWSKIKSKKPIGELLMEQKIFAGIGNYLRADILYHCRINPKATLATLQKRELTDLYNSTMEILQESVKLKGLSFQSYTQPDGSPGGYQTRIYGESYDPDDYPVETMKMGGRTVHWVPRVQTRGM